MHLKITQQSMLNVTHHLTSYYTRSCVMTERSSYQMDYDVLLWPAAYQLILCIFTNSKHFTINDISTKECHTVDLGTL